MDRLQFLKTLGLSGSALMAVLTSCQQADVSPTGPVDFEIDLKDVSSTPLTRVGGYIVLNGVVVARVNPFRFIAVTNTCSHQGQKQVTFRNGEFVCLAHGARFDEEGKGLNEEGKRGLKTYKVEKDGTRLRVFS